MGEASPRIADRIEIPPVSLLRTHAEIVDSFRDISSRLGLSLGWHYLLDLAWAAEQLGHPRGQRILDAGSGSGVMQWWLAERGATVIAADQLDRRHLDAPFRRRYRVQGWRPQDLADLPRPSIRAFLPPRAPSQWARYPRKLRNTFAQLFPRPKGGSDIGTVYLYHQDLKSLNEIPDSSVDAVVSISALEHNAANDLRLCVGELMRVLRPGGRLVATLGAARDRDWFHEPSRGWCYTERTLRETFSLPASAASNYDSYDELLSALRGSTELRAGLEPGYSLSGDNGMPWGIWNPEYQPVGVVKIKSDGPRR